MNNQAYLHIFEGRVNEAINIYDQILSQAKQMNDTLLWVSALNNAGVAYGNIGYYTEALRLLELSITLSTKHDLEPAYQSLADIFLKIGNKDSAFEYLQKAISSKRVETRASAYALLSELQKEEGDFRNSLKSLENYQSCLDSIHSKTQTLEIARISHKHELDLISLKARSRQRLWITFTSLGFLIILSSAVGGFFYWNKKRKLALLLYKHQLLEQKNNIYSLNNQLLELQNELLLLQPIQSEKNNIQDLIQQKEQELEIMQNKITELRIKLFASTHIGKKILLENERSKQKKEVNLMKANERSEIIQNLDEIFEDTISNMLISVPTLTKEDCYFCCLALMGISTQVLAACFGYSDSSAIRQRKYRIKQKLSSNKACTYLYEQIFGI